MADGKTRIYSLPEVTEVNSDMYIMLDASATGTRKYNLKTMYDKIDGVDDAKDAAQEAADSATTAAASATSAASAAASAATSAQSTVQSLVTNAQTTMQGFMADATETMDGLVDDVNDALDAIGDISEQAVPLMSPTTRGGAKLGHGLAIEDGALGIGEVTDPTDAGPIVELTAKGWATQDGTPSPSYPQEIRRCTGHTISGKTGRYVDILVTHDGTTTTIPIPLPSRGWVAALPDGTCDTLTLDGAGGYVWTLNTGMLDLAQLTWAYRESGTAAPLFYSGIANNIIAYEGVFSSTAYPMLAEDFIVTRRSDATMTDGHMSLDGNTSAGTVTQIQCKMTDITTVEDFVAALGDSSNILYPLATPTTESGYVDSMPTVPVHASISSTDLHDLTVRCCVDEGAAEIASAWGRKYESRIANLESAVATLVAAGA